MKLKFDLLFIVNDVATSVSFFFLNIIVFHSTVCGVKAEPFGRKLDLNLIVRGVVCSKVAVCEIVGAVSAWPTWTSELINNAYVDWSNNEYFLE
jgi:hypothetical protein